MLNSIMDNNKITQGFSPINRYHSHPACFDDISIFIYWTLDKHKFKLVMK